MIIADFLDYETAKVYDQGKTQTCVPHTFFTILSEHIQQRQGEEVEFDFYKYFDEMEADRKPRQLRAHYLCTKAVSDGYKTKDGRLVKIKSFKRSFAYRNWYMFCREIQLFGPQLFAVKTYRGHKLDPKNTDIIEMPTEKQFKNVNKDGHAMMIRGFDYPRKLIKFQNSWGKIDSVKWMPYDVFMKIVKYVYYVKRVEFKD